MCVLVSWLDHSEPPSERIERKVTVARSSFRLRPKKWRVSETIVRPMVSPKTGCFTASCASRGNCRRSGGRPGTVPDRARWDVD